MENAEGAVETLASVCGTSVKGITSRDASGGGTSNPAGEDHRLTARGRCVG